MIIFSICIIGGTLLIYILSVNNRAIDQEWINRLNEKCGQNYNYENIEASSLYACALIQLIFGWIYGLYFLK